MSRTRTPRVEFLPDGFSGMSHPFIRLPTARRLLSGDDLKYREEAVLMGWRRDSVPSSGWFLTPCPVSVPRFQLVGNPVWQDCL